MREVVRALARVALLSSLRSSPAQKCSPSPSTTAARFSFGQGLEDVADGEDQAVR